MSLYSGKVFLVSFPRSGLHMTERLLCELYHRYDLDYSFCEFASCCLTEICKKGCIFQKRHDEAVNMGISPDAKYVILYREDIIQQLEAYFRYDFGYHHGKNIEIDYDNEKKTYKSLISFIKNKKKYYKKFVDKWIVERASQYDNVIVMKYDQIVADPTEQMYKLLSFLNPDVVFPKDDIKLFLDVREEKICYRNRLSESVYNRIIQDL